MQQEFAQWLEGEKRLLAHTASAYLSDLSQFQEYLENEYGIHDFTEVSSSIVRSWFVKLHQIGYKAVSLHRKKAALSTFFDYCQQTGRSGFSGSNPVNSVELPKGEKRITSVAKEESILCLLNRELFPETRKGIRDYTILELLYGTGIRRAELINLKFKDWLSDSLKIRGKGSKERLIPLNPVLKEWLPKYLKEEEYYRSLRGDSYFFVTNKNNPIYPMYVQRVVKSALGGNTTVQQQSPHQLRHAFATHLLEKGADLNAIKALLGHEQLNATSNYLNASVKHLKSVYNRSHPKAK